MSSASPPRPSPPAVAIVLAAGRGERLGHALPKAFVPLAGETLVERSIRALALSGCFSRIQPVLAQRDFERFSRLGLTDAFPIVCDPVEGGAERQDSMGAGLAALAGEMASDPKLLIAVHDAARCLVTPADIRAVVEAAQQTGAALLGERSRDTLKRVTDGQVMETPDRAECWAAQTPQVIRRDWLERGVAEAAAAGRIGTDDAQLVEWIGEPVRMVESMSPNPKITRPEDLLMAEALLQNETTNGRSA